LENPKCAICGNPSKIVDHINPHRGRESIFWEVENLQSLCKSCHDKKTMKEIHGEKRKRNSKIDNSMPELKAELRRRYLPEHARVLDLFCGTGEMYRLAYQGNVDNYFGIDKDKIHDKSICRIQKNMNFVCNNSLDQFNVFDLDDYGSPWKLFYQILKRVKKGKYTFFLTDGLWLNLRIPTNEHDRFFLSVNRIPRKMAIFNCQKFYFDFIKTMLIDIEKRFGIKIEKAIYFHNRIKTAFYWMISIEKL